MADVGVLIWNIEKFGAFSELKKGPDGGWIDGTLNAIALIVNANRIDILIIQEFRKEGAAWLPRLCKFLGDGWSFDYLPGSINDFLAPTDVKSIDNLAYTVPGNSEGYAVVWKGDVLLPFPQKMSKGLNGDNSKNGYVSLVLYGSGPAFDAKKAIAITPDGKGFAAPALFPRTNTATITSDAQNQFKNDSVLLFSMIRRPCWIGVKSPQSGAAIPVIAFHSPVDNPYCFYGALACTLITEVGQTPYGNVILGGDFNLTAESQFAALTTRYSELALNNGTRNPTKSGEFGFARTQVQFEKKFQKPPALVDADKTYEHPRDVLFYRNTIKNPQSGVIDVVADLMTTRAMAQKIFADKYVQTSVLGALTTDNEKYMLPKVVRDDASLVAAIKKPFTDQTPFSSALAAAVFYRSFVSDHLPVTFTITDNN